MIMDSLAADAEVPPITWDYPVNLIGEKVVDPMIHSCEICNNPIIVYGRLIPCKHVFCLECASAHDKLCPRCKEAVERVEQNKLGQIFLCTYGAPRHSHQGCRRTYLSQRDLQAHINHRHVPKTEAGSTKKTQLLTSSTQHTPSGSSPAVSTPPTPMQSVGRGRSNLITIQLQGDSDSATRPQARARGRPAPY